MLVGIALARPANQELAVEDPVTLRRFRHFINSDRPDDNVVFVEERGQIRPATAAERAQQREIA